MYDELNKMTLTIKSLETSSFCLYTPVCESKAQQPRNLHTPDCLRLFIERGEKDMDRLTDDAHDKTQQDLEEN